MRKAATLWLVVSCFVIFPLCVHAQEAKEAFDENALIAYLKGVYLESENDLTNAYQYYLYAAAREPGNTRILLRLAKVAVEVGDLDRAREYSEELIKRDSYGVEARIILAEVEYRLGNKEAALRVLTELHSIDDVSQFQVLKFLAKVYFELKRSDDARSALEEATTFPEADFSVFYELGLLYAQAGYSEKAVEAFGKAVAMNPDFSNAHLALARLFLQAGKREEAMRSYRETLRIEPDNKNVIKELADLYYETGQYAQGAELLAPLYREGTLADGAAIIYGRFLHKAGKVDEALAVFNELVKKMGEKAPLLRVIAELEIGKGHFKTAFEILKRLVEIEPDRFENYVGILLVLSGAVSGPSGPDEAVLLTEEEKRGYLDEAAARMNPDSEESNYIMGSILRKAGELEKAEQFLLKAERINAKNESTLLELASLYGRTGKYNEALKRVIFLYDEDPEDPSLANFYGYLLAEKGESLDLAEQLLAKALAKEPQNGYFLDSLGWIRFKKGRFREALDILLKAAGKAEDDAVIWEHIGDTYVKLNESSKAMNAYQKSLAIDPKAKNVDDKIRKLTAGEQHYK
jgi:tetratricopeptide (TPR) repeat protein